MEPEATSGMRKSPPKLRRWKRAWLMLSRRGGSGSTSPNGCFRCLLMRDTHAVGMYSKSGQDLSRYFPEVVAAALTLRGTQFLLDGEIVVPVGGRFSFDDLLQRIHPAASRVKKLAEQTPALFLAFDLLKKGKLELAAVPLTERRLQLEDFAADVTPSGCLPSRDL